MEEPQYLYTWIHLSDIHLGHGGPSHQVKQKLVLGMIEQDILERFGRGERRKPDAILVTGDIAFSGAVRQKDEYKEAEEWLSGLAQQVGVPQNRVFVIPGNHDIQRQVDDRNASVRRLRDELRKGADLVATLQNKKDRKLLAQRLRNYLEFSRDFAPANALATEGDAPLYWDFRIPVSGRFGIHLVGLNTALLCTGREDDPDSGKLQLGAEQFALLQEGDTGHDLVVALSHHPFDWLKDGKEFDAMLPSYAHVHLFGHEHRAELWTVTRGDNSLFLRIAAGAAHEEQSANPPQHSYNIVSLWENTDGRVMLRIWPRVSISTGKFRPHYDVLPDESPYADQPTNLVLQPLSEPADGKPPLTAQGWGSGSAEPHELSLGVLRCSHLDEQLVHKLRLDLPDPTANNERAQWWWLTGLDDITQADRSRVEVKSLEVLSCPESVERDSFRNVSAFILFQTSDPRCEACIRSLDQVLAHARRSGTPLLVVRVGPDEVPEALLDARVPRSFIPPLGEPLLRDGSSDLDAALEKSRREVQQRLVEIAKNQARYPSVGIGVLLLNDKGKLLLTERLRSPEVGTYATFGGPLPSRQSIHDELHDLGERELGLNHGDLEVGPLLCYSDVQDGSKHYVDLTFLAVTTPKAKPHIRDTLRRSIRDAAGKSRMWFSFDEVMRFYRDDKLFTPVKTAFERLCILCLSNYATKGLLSRAEHNPFESSTLTLELDGLTTQIRGLPSAQRIARFLLKEEIPIDDPVHSVPAGGPL